MKKILVALDTSGSVNIKHAQRFTTKFISTLCPDAKIDFSLFDHRDCKVVDMNDFLAGNVFFGGAGSSTTFARSVAEDGDYDHLYIITDGYMDKHELDESTDVSVVIYEEA